MPTSSPGITTTAAVVEAANAGFTLAEIEMDAPRPHEVVVRMVAAGICHTDLSVARGLLPFPLPGVLGHEGAGVVEATGDAVTAVRPGDRVLLSFTSCGGCAHCRAGHPAYCADWLTGNLLGGSRADGTATLRRGGATVHGHFFGQSSFARRALVDERSVVKVGPDAPLELLAPLGCCATTGAGAVWNVLRPRPGATLLVTGAGAVGLCAVMAARLTPVARIIVVDRVPERLELARELGATHVVDTAGAELTGTVTAITGGAGADGVVETTGSTRVAREAVGTLAARGTAVLVGAPPFGEELGLDVNFMLGGRTVTGLTLGDSDIQVMLPLLAGLVAAGRYPLERLIRHYPFESIEQAVADTASGAVIKPVLRF